MNGQEFFQAVKAQFESDGWQLQSKQLDSNVVLLRGQRNGTTVFCMVVNGEASGAHVQRLAELADDAGVGNLAIAANQGYDTAAQTVIEQRGVRTIDVGNTTSSGTEPTTADDEDGQVSRRTAVLAVLGAGAAGVGGFYFVSGGADLSVFGDSVGDIPIVELRPESPDFRIESGTVTPVPEESDAEEIDVDILVESEIDSDLELEFVGLTFADDDGTLLADVDLRTVQTLPAAETTTFDGRYDVPNPPDWTAVSEAYATFTTD